MKSNGIRYLIAGGLSVGVDYGLLLFLYRIIGFKIELATTVSFICGLTVNFLLIRLWVFEVTHTSGVHTISQGVMYGALTIVNLAITNFIVVSMARHKIGPEYSKIASTALITSWNFLIYKKVIFRK